MSQGAEGEARNAGRGGVLVLGAKVFFIVIGFIQQALLKHALGLSEYGALSRVLAHANILNNVVVQGSIQGVSRRVAPVREHFEGELRACLRVHVPLAFALAAAFFLLAEPIAAFQKAAHIASPLRVMALVILAYGIYAPLVGALNGRARFDRQAALDVIFATLRTIGLVGLGWLFVRRDLGGAVGASVGFASAALLVVPLAARWAQQRDRASAGRADAEAHPTKLSAGTYLAALSQVAIAQLLVNALMQIDITLAGRFLSEAALLANSDAGVAAKRADEWVGVYRACQLFAFLPYQLVLSVAQVLFPMVARAHAQGNDKLVAETVERGLRIATLLAGAIVAIVAANPGTLLRFAYGQEVSDRGADTLRILALGQGAFALFGVASTVLVSLGRERTSAILSGAALSVVAATCWAFVSGATFGEEQLRRTALATSLGLAIAVVLAGVAVKRAAGAFAPLLTLLRVALAIATAAASGLAMASLPKLPSLVVAALGATTAVLAYAAVLWLTRELTSDDGRSVVRLVRKPR